MKRIILSCIIITLVGLFFSCEKEKDFFIILNPWVNYGSITDKDGNTYKTILIGTQTWMAENLKTMKFNDGVPIQQVSDPISWDNLTTPAGCWQNNDPVRKVTYGVLYNWYSINTGKLCPAGWHVPSAAEWTILLEVYFSAYPGGDRQDGPDAKFENLREKGNWWTASFENDNAISRTVSVNNNNVTRFFHSKKMGMSVRCVWNY